MKIKPSQKPGSVVVEVGQKDESMLSATPSGDAPDAKIFALRKILVPVDFSACSIKSLNYAVPIAKQFGARLLLLYVLPIQYFVGSEFGPMDFPMPEMELLQTSAKELETLATREVQDSVPVQCRVERGQPVHQIVEIARETETDLIILATHGHTGLKHVLLGSVAENVTRYAPCPVLVVREQERDFVDMSPRESQQES